MRANPELQLAHEFIQNTGQHLFLTGKAGTGKTTFLHQLKENTPKRLIVTAPTGVAAINAGGVTLHSFFQLPFSPYVPGSDMQQRRFNKEKINIIKSLDLLIIDEISMVRADLLDAVDAVLRRYKNHRRPFGGVQLLMIGDLHQLPPVVKDEEWALLKPYYDSPYFFSSKALQQTELISIELKHIYRQSDAQFIELLNRVRDNRLDDDTVRRLNARYIPDFQPGADQDYITLSTHNHSADRINRRQLQELPSKPVTFTASIEGDYPEYSYPTAAQLALKKGAQVMFVRNDSSANKRYFNGKIGKITHIDQGNIRVRCAGDEEDILVGPETWENINYTLDASSRQITEQVIGRFTQYPLRLAWAITIHKSQGLTFERAIIDARAAFSHGQVYVALSRCKSFDGVVLSAPIPPGAIHTDKQVAEFVAHAGQYPPTTRQLHMARIRFQQTLLLDAFDYHELAKYLNEVGKQLAENRHLIQCTGGDLFETIRQQTFAAVIPVADKFQRQLNTMFTDQQAPQEDPRIQERVQKASRYFTDKLKAGLDPWLSAFSFDADNKDIRKQLDKACKSLRQQLAIKTAALHSCRDGFSTNAYLNSVARARIDMRAPPAAGKRTALSPEDMPHPQLVQSLQKWRTEQAGTEQLNAYRILHQRVLIRIAAALPGTKDTLNKIDGVGKRTVEKYGEQLLALVAGYCDRHGIKPGVTIPTAEKTTVLHKKDTKQISYEMFLQGKTIAQIAAARGLVTGTIEGHLAHYVKLGKLNIHEVVAPEKIATIKQAADEKGRGSLKVLKEYLGEAYSYGEIRLVLEASS